MKTDRKTEVKRVKLVDRTEKVVQKLVENGANSVSETMRQVGFSNAYASNPGKLKDTAKFNKLLKKYLPDNVLVDRHSQLINSSSDQVSLNAVELAYKLKGKTQKDGGGSGDNVSQEIQAVIVRIRNLLPDSQG